ncbi:hypothetical protein, partial [Klebsiella pneumoniae]|uniref:hypothetical protein n=1 Tax=Klebsiella pneumoniae TaxID=573 RepID=UPI0015F2A896
MHFWRTKGTLPGIIANVKAASPQENRALQRCSALFYPVLGQQNPLNYFIYLIKEGANKQVISSQADSLIKISRIWADFFPANTS